MTDKFRKIDREYVLSDSSVNEYGFRLLTSGYQMESFRKNPIGYYMHRREDGIALKWDDLKVTDDQVTGTPVINLSNGRGVQLCDEAENGFLNAASMGHIVVLEYSTDPELALPGQTGPTITKWYNKECSLVDIPGNSNALCKLYDAQENEMNLVDMTPAVMKMPQRDTLKELSGTLQLADCSDTDALITAVQDLISKADHLDLENKTLRNDKHALQQQLDELVHARNRFEITAVLNRALEDKKVTVELRDKLARDYAGNPEGLRELIAAMPAYQSIAALLRSKQQNNAEALWEWDDYEKNDPAGVKLRELKANEPDRYKELDKARYFDFSIRS